MFLSREEGPEEGFARRSQLTNFFFVALCFVRFQESRPNWTYKQIATQYQHETGNYERKISTSTVARLLAEADFSTKNLYTRPLGRNTDSTLNARQAYCQWASRIEEDDMIFLDESGINLHMNRRRGRSRVGVKATIETTNSKGGNISLIAALSPTRGILLHRVKTGPVRGKDYADFLKELLQLPALLTRSHVIIQDNASIHKTDDVKECYTGLRVAHEHKFLPPYSPQLNPIELAFSKIKAHIKVQEKHNRTQLMSLIEQAVSTVTADDAKGWYREVTRWYVVGAARQEFTE
jgi:transposase